MAFGSLIQSKVVEAISHISLNPVASSKDSSQLSDQAPRSLDMLFLSRANNSQSSRTGPGSTLPDADNGSDDGSASAWSMDSEASSVQLLDGTDAMVKCLRKGSTALECPVCLHLYCNPVVPMNCGCRCTFCEGCLENLIRISDGKCSSCQQDLPKKIGSWVPNQEIIDAIAKFQKQGGEDAEYANMINQMKDTKKRAKYPILRISEFDLDPNPIATGAYGQVFRGVWKGNNNASIALKKIFLNTSTHSRQQVLGNFRKECEVLAMLDHPHVLRLYGAVDDDENVCIVTELVPGGSLFDLIHTKPLLRPEAVIVIGGGVCKGMTYLHSMGVIHRDLKPGNLLMAAVHSPAGPQLVVKVADFGLARVQDSTRTMTGGIGTSQYTAPEVLRSERYDSKVDVYSFGIILWEIHAKRLPYSDMNQMQIAVAVATQNHRPPPPPNCPAPFWQLMQSCWSSRPADRPSFSEVLCQLEDMQYVFNLVASTRNTQGHSDSYGGQSQGGSFSRTLNGGNENGEGGGDAMPISGEHSSVLGEQGEPAGRRVLRVPEHFSSIGEAVRSARADDRVLISPGHYRESVEIPPDLVLEIVGDADLSGLLLEGVDGRPVLTQVGGFVRVSKLAMKSSGPAVVAAKNSMLVIEDCFMSGGQVGLLAIEGGEVTIRRSVFCRCREHGIFLGAGLRAIIESSSVFENGSHGVLAAKPDCSLHVTRSKLSFNAGAGIFIDNGGGGLVEDNDLRNNTKGPLVVGVSSVGSVVLGSNLT